MKLQRLHINNFGHFGDFDLEIPDSGLQIIYGPNEAGKTTLLEFLRGWMFDFPARTPYDFKSGSDVAGVGTATLSDGRTIEMRRRKGNKNKVSVRIDGRDTDLDAVGFQRLIGHANQSLFESVFAFGLDQLSRGTETLKHESLQSALFGGGLGNTASPEQILQQLDKQAREIFDSNSRRNTSTKATLAEIKDLAALIKTKSLRSDDYHHCLTVVAEAEARAAELHERTGRIRREHQRVEKLARAHQKWTELQRLTIQRQSISIPATLPTDGRARFTALMERLQSVNEEIERLTHVIESLERELAVIQLDPSAVSYRADIRACLELRQSYMEAGNDLPRLKSDLAAVRQQIDRELTELRPGWTHEDLRSFVIDVATRADIDRLIEADRAGMILQTELRTKREQVHQALKQSAAELESLGAVRDVTSFEAVLALETSYLNDRKELEVRTIEAAKIDRQLSGRLKKLNPPLPSEMDAPHELRVPRMQTVTEFETAFEEWRRQLHAASDFYEENEGQRRNLQADLVQVISSGAVPSLEESHSARKRRDAEWKLIRRRLIDGHETAWFGTDPKSLSDSFEETVRQADEIADRIYQNADAVARREELSRQLDLVRQRLEQNQIRIQDLKLQEQELNDRWAALWRDCGFEPLTPDEMGRWLTDHEAACEIIVRRDENRAETEVLAQRTNAFEERLATVSQPNSGDIPILLAAAHQAVDQAADHRRRSVDLKREIQQLELQRDACERDLIDLSKKDDDWKTQWRAILSRLRLPTEWGTELTAKVVERLSATRYKLDGLPQEENRIQAMQARLDEFCSMVGQLCTAIAPELLRDPPELAAQKLSDQLECAAEAQKHYDQLRKQRDDARDSLKLMQDRCTKLYVDRGNLFAAATVQSEPEFLDVVSRAETGRQLDANIDRLNSEIELIRAGEDREEFQRSLSLLEPVDLDERRRVLSEQLQVADMQKSEADGAVAVAKTELARLDGSSETAILTDSLSRKRAHLAAEIDRYVPLLFARHLLSEAVRRFDRDNQPQMIGTVSRLLSEMTAGRYVEFDRTTGNTPGILVRRFDGVERTPEQLSTGTREQLYLAIRLAYVLHYCRQNEPLPIVMDDVLVNFDDGRVRQTLSALAEVAKSVQILFFTCHVHMVEIAREIFTPLTPIMLPDRAAVVA